MTKKAKNPVGRPKRVFTPEEVAKIEEMAKNNLHTLTIANALGIPEPTLRDNFQEVLTQKRAEGKAELSKQQKDACKEGDRTILIWRGKQDLGQADKQEITGKGGGPLLPPQLIVRAEKG